MILDFLQNDLVPILIILIYFFPLHIYTLYSCRKGIKSKSQFVTIWILIAVSWGFPFFFTGIMFLGAFGAFDSIFKIISFIFFFLLFPGLLDLVIYFLFKKKSVNEEVLNNKDINMKTAQQVNPQQTSTIPNPPNQNMTPPEATTEMK